eukprot:m.232146 g.232146  ORF g.232146 m.232146 type:complete len:58 (-) comp15710_c0_seq2:1649-1822(-)
MKIKSFARLADGPPPSTSIQNRQKIDILCIPKRSPRQSPTYHPTLCDADISTATTDA